jgi:hypothetical protein
LRGGELVSPVGCVASKLSGLDLPTPDARHRRPLKFFSENRGAKFLKITSEAVGAGGWLSGLMWAFWAERHRVQIG